MQTDLTSGAHHGRTGQVYVWGLPRGNRKRRNCFDLCGPQSPAAAAQARPAMDGALRGHEQEVGGSGQKRRWPTWVALGCRVVCAVGGVDAREASPRPRHGSVSGRKCGGTGVHWPTGRPPAADSGPLQHRPGLYGPGQRGRGGDQRVDAACGQGLWLCRCQYPVGGYHRAGVSHWVSQRTRYLAGFGTALWPSLGKAQNARRGGSRRRLEQVQTILRSVKEHHLFAKGKQEKRQVLTRLLTEVGQLVVQTRSMVQRLGESRERMTHGAVTTLKTMHEVARRLVPQIVQWITTGVVAKGKIVHAGVTQARAIVRNKTGKQVEFGLPYLLSRLGGGYVFGTLLRGVVDESKMPLQALAGYRVIFGAHATPTLVVYDRGGYASATIRALANEGVKEIGLQPKGQGAWHVAEAVRETVRSERGKTEGIIGTLKTDKYGFNRSTERLWHTLEMAGPRSILSFNLNKLMRDLVRADR